MKFKRILSGILAATVAVSSLAVSSFTAYGEDAPSDVVLPDSGAWKKTEVSNSAKLELVNNFASGEIISKLAGKKEIYVTFDVTGVNDDTEAYLPIAVKNSATHWNADASCPLVETPTDGTYTVKYSGDAISDDAVFNYLGINFKTKSSNGSKDKTVTSIKLKYVTLTDPSQAEPPAGDGPEPTDYIFDFSYSSSQKVYYATLKSDYVNLLKAKDTTEIVFPEEYDDKTHGTAPVNCLSFKLGNATNKDTYVTSIIFNSHIDNTSSLSLGGPFANAIALGKVIYKYEGADFKLNSLVRNSTSNTSDSIKELYLYAESVDCYSGAFANMSKDLKIYVKSQEVKQSILDATKDSSYVVEDDQIIIMESEPDPTDYIFDFSYSSSQQVYYATLKSDYVNLLKEKGTTEIVFPEEYDDKTHGTAPVNCLSFKLGNATNKDTYVTSIIFNSHIDNTSSLSLGGPFANAIALGKVIYKYEGADFKLNSLVRNSTSNTSDSIKELYLYAESVDCYSGAFANMSKDLKIYVKSQEVKQSILDATKDSSYVVEDDQIIIMSSEPFLSWTFLDLAISDAQDYVDNHSDEYTEGSMSALKDALAKATALKENPSATQEMIDSCVKELKSAIDSLVKQLNLKEYNAAKKAVEDIITAEDSPYTAKSIESVRAIYDYQTGKRYNAAIESNSQSEIDDITKVLNESISKLVKKGDATVLQPLVDDCAKLVESDYTLDSWKLVKDKLAAAQALLDDPDNAGEEDIATTKDELTKAIEALVVDYSEGEKTSGIGKIMSFGKETTLDSGKADESMAGAVKIRYIFDCAADTDFSEYTTIDATAVINGTNNYKQFKGNNNQKGAKDCSVTLDLASAIKAGDSYTIKADTYAWEEAADYVYLVTRIEYLDADGKVLKMFTGGGETAKLDKYKKAIEDAKALVESGEYTEESVAALQTAIDNAQALLDETDGKPLPSQMEDPAAALDEAIKALVEMPKGDISGTVATPGTDVEVTVTIATADGTEVSEVTSANGEYTLADLEDGDYVITFTVEGYVTRSYTATVAGGAVNIEAELHMVGDINGDGNITTVDVGLANAHAKGTKTLEGYDFDVANVSGDENVTTVDVGIINSIAKGTK